MPAADVQVLGAGPVGCTLALALADSAHRVRVVDPQAGGALPAFRPIALSHASRLILERVGAWGAFPVTPIGTIHVSQAGAFGRTRLEAREAGVPALGYVTQYADLLAALRARLGIEREPGAAPRLAVHAEGSAADSRERRYAQDAIVARVAAEPASQATAYERFTAEGPLGADLFLYLNSVPEPFAVQLLAGRLQVATLVPSLNVIELAAPPTGSEPVMLIPGSLDSSTSLGALVSINFLPAMP